MAIPTTAEIAAVPDFTAAEMLRWFKGQMMRIASEGDAYTINGRTGQEASQYIESQIRFWQDRVDQEAQASAGGVNGSGNVLVRISR